MPQPKRVSDSQLLKAYKKTKSVHRAGLLLGITGGSVHERLVKLGVQLRFPRWTKEHDEILRAEYVGFRNRGQLHVLAERLGRTKPFICRQAKRLGLTEKSAAKPYHRVWKGMSEKDARQHFERFKKSRLGLLQFCAKNGFDDLGFSICMRFNFPDEWEHVIELKAPRQTMYRLGRSVEYAVRDYLKCRGYIAMRSPRSLGAVDIVGIKRGSVLFVQAKRSMALGVLEWNALFDLAESVGAIPLLAGRPTGSGLVFKRLLSRKDGSKKRQPMDDYEP